MSQFILSSDDKSLVYNKAIDVWSSAYNELIPFDIEGRGFDEFLLGLGDFASDYIDYQVAKLLGPATYPTWNNDISQGVLAAFMTERDNLSNVFIY